MHCNGSLKNISIHRGIRIAQHTVNEAILVSTDEICAAIKDIFDDTRSIAEPAGALGVAGLKKYVEREGISGANFQHYLEELGYEYWSETDNPAYRLLLNGRMSAPRNIAC